MYLLCLLCVLCGSNWVKEDQNSRLLNQPALFYDFIPLNNIMNTSNQRPPLPPFTEQTARQKIQMAEDAWNSRDPERVSLAYTVNSEWRNRNQFFSGREAIVAFLTEKWKRELNYRLKKEYWAHTGNRIAVRFEYEYHNAEGQWYRAYGNENWEFDENGLMARRYASINDLAIAEADRKFL
jgi:uncharacterized protein